MDKRAGGEGKREAKFKKGDLVEYFGKEYVVITYWGWFKKFRYTLMLANAPSYFTRKSIYKYDCREEDMHEWR
jgi:hypothetical protein